MKKIQPILLAILTVFIFIKCQKEFSGANLLPGSINEVSPITTNVYGTVLDENGTPAVGAKVSAGAKSSVTNVHGFFRINDAALDKNTSIVSVEQNGYFTAFRSFRATKGANRLIFQLTKKSQAGSFSSSSGGAASLSNGSKIVLPANGVTKANGQPYSGDVLVFAAYIDPTLIEIGRRIPGSLMADDIDNKRVLLSSYGMLAVELQSAAGEILQIAPGKTANLTFAIPTSLLASAPATISLWYLDEQSGVWKQAGEASKNGNKYSGEVNHFSYWNCDIRVPAISFTATLKTSDNSLLSGAYVVVKIANGTSPADTIGGGGSAHGYSDSAGVLSGLIPANKNLVLQIYDECYSLIFSKNIGPFAANTDLGDIVIPTSSQSLIQVKGKLVDCNGLPVTKGFAQIAGYYNVYYARVNSAGEFSASFLTCRLNSGSVQVTGVDEINQQQSSTIELPVTASLVDAGTLTACGTSTVEFINYKLDGTDYTIPAANADTLIAFSYIDSFSGSSNLFLNVMGKISSPNNKINFQLKCNDSPGVYPLTELYVANYNQVQTGSPFNVTITAFPKLVGEFYEGSFTGSFVDASNNSVTHIISCSFRIKKRY